MRDVSQTRPTKLGFFHFGDGYENPIRALEVALYEADDPTNALIVLPEGFNLGVQYRGPGTRNFKRTVVFALKRLAEHFRATFIAGLVIRGPCGPRPPYSTVYLIDKTTHALLCSKGIADDTEAQSVGHHQVNYTRRINVPDFRNPIQYGGLAIGALICGDAIHQNRESRSHWDRIRRVVNASDVICVPSHMGCGNFNNGKSGSAASLIPEWRHKFLILANSKSDGIDSFVTDGDGTILEPTVGGSQNKVVTLPLLLPNS